MSRKTFGKVALGILGGAWAGVLMHVLIAGAQVPPAVEAVEDIASTKHNLSTHGPAASGQAGYTVYSASGEICVFCHTPHGGTEGTQVNGPLWNRHLSNVPGGYKLYDQVWSRSFEGEVHPGAPTGYSRLCLSCHDGTIALGSMINAPGSGGFNSTTQESVPVQQRTTSGTQAPGAVSGGPSGITMPAGLADDPNANAYGGDTRRLGTDLTNDHPVSFRFDSLLAQKDAELVDPGPPLANIAGGSPISPLRRAEGTTQGVFDSVQCTSCHNPHAVTYPKFLRAPIWQNDPAGSDILCLNCHNKPGWAGSTHAVSPAVRSQYPKRGTSTDGYDFDGTHTVAQTACRNCHDPHTAQGAKRLHREGVGAYAANAEDAVESTCFLCHAPNQSAIGANAAGYTVAAGDPTNAANPRFTTATVAPDIYSHFAKDQLQQNCQPANGSVPPVYSPASTHCGSAMNLKLATGHDPVFIANPGEGVELASPNPPAGNEGIIGLGKPDNAHIECTDCHNPHQVVPGNRLKGMRGIDINGNVVGPGVPGNDREAYVFEVCLRCHGNSYVNVFVGDRFPDDTTHRSDPRDLLPTKPSFSYRGFSNKRKEFDPNTPDTAIDHTQQPVNAAFHPVASPGRNRSPQLDKQLQMSGSGLTVNSTIQCTDCHNSDQTSVVAGPVTESNLRATDTPSGFLPLKPVFPDYPAIGPHGSTKLRLLRNNYNTDILNPDRCYEGNPAVGGVPPGSKLGCTASDGASANHWNNFLLCFQCHDRRAFDPNWPGADRVDPSWTRFFGSPAYPSGVPGQGTNWWNGNLHMYHLQWTGAYCHECHYNVHSNVEATNTIYGNGAGGLLPPDATDGALDGVVNTHLINFGPQAEGTLAAKPVWRYQNNRFSCAVRCHGEVMDFCSYQSPDVATTLTPDGTTVLWCAGGDVPG
ncbi:MAG: cytochrome c3 family protein [Nitrospirota bacterium]|nr:cytochrome c3 family protein [Nitrospirota bacterium]